MTSKLKIVMLAAGAGGLAITGLWLAVRLKDPFWLLLGLPAFALIMA